MEEKKTKKKRELGISLHSVLTVLGITLTVLLIPILTLNMVLIVRGTINDAKPPSVFGITPLVVLSGSMDDGSYGAIAVGDLILVKDVDAENLKENEVVAFMEDGYAVTHRIVAVHNEKGQVSYTTRGDANNTDDTIPLMPENVIGQYFYRVPKVGNFILYLQTTGGMLLFVGLPIILFVIYDTVRRHMFTKSEQAKQEQLKKELEELKRKPTQANAYRPVQGQVLKQPNSPPAPPPPQPKAPAQPMPQQTAPQAHQPARQPVAPPPPPPPAAPRPQPASPLPPAQQQPARPPRQAPSMPTSASKAPTQAKPVAKKATVQIKKSTKPRK